MFKKIQLAIIIFTLNVGSVVHADVTNWIVKNVVGQAVLTKQDNSRKWIRQFDIVGPGDRVQTYSNGTVALVRDAEAMIVSANSEIFIPVRGNNNSFTLIFQRLGTILFSAKKKNHKHFEVRTPFSAAIIKGTTLAVNVNRSNAQLQVFEGAVELKRRGRRRSHIVRSGGKALTPRNQNRPIKLNKVRNTSLITPHFGNNVKKLTETYVSKISIGKTRAKKFKLTNVILNKQQKSRITPKGLQPTISETLHQVKTKNAYKERKNRSYKADVNRDNRISNNIKSQHGNVSKGISAPSSEKGRVSAYNPDKGSAEDNKSRSKRNYGSKDSFKNKIRSAIKNYSKNKVKFRESFRNNYKQKSRASSNNSFKNKVRSSFKDKFSSSFKNKVKSNFKNKVRSNFKSKSGSSSSNSFKNRVKSSFKNRFKNKSKSRSKPKSIKLRAFSSKGGWGKSKK